MSVPALRRRFPSDKGALVLEVWSGMWHVFQGFASIIPEARKAVENIGTFVSRHLEAGDMGGRGEES